MQKLPPVSSPGLHCKSLSTPQPEWWCHCHQHPWQTATDSPRLTSHPPSSDALGAALWPSSAPCWPYTQFQLKISAQGLLCPYWSPISLPGYFLHITEASLTPYIKLKSSPQIHSFIGSFSILALTAILTLYYLPDGLIMVSLTRRFFPSPRYS